MKILFIGIGLTDYYNQILNKMSDEKDLQIFNLVPQKGKGHTGEGVHQTTEGVKFNIRYLKEQRNGVFNDLNYKSFINLDKLLREIGPNIIVSSETYIKSLYSIKKNLEIIKKQKIKIIMKDIPFRLKKYQEIEKEILSGKAQNEYCPNIIRLIHKAMCMAKINWLFILLNKFTDLTKIKYFYKKIFAKNNLLKILENKRKILNLPDAHVNYVEDAFEIFGSYGVPKEKIHIIYNSPDTDMLFKIREKVEKEKPLLPYSDYRLIHLGRLIPWKNIDLLIKSIYDLIKEFPKIELLIIGTGPEENKLKKLAKELNIENRVKFLGGIYNPEEIGRYLISSSIYVLAGMGGISINDAMIFGKPVICSVCDGTEKKLVYNEINGLYFKDGDQTDLTEKIKKILMNKDRIKKMGEMSTEIIKNNINIHTVINGYKKAFDYVLKN